MLVSCLTLGKWSQVSVSVVVSASFGLHAFFQVPSSCHCYLADLQDWELLLPSEVTPPYVHCTDRLKDHIKQFLACVLKKRYKKIVASTMTCCCSRGSGMCPARNKQIVSPSRNAAHVRL